MIWTSSLIVATIVASYLALMILGILYHICCKYYIIEKNIKEERDLQLEEARIPTAEIVQNDTTNEEFPTCTPINENDPEIAEFMNKWRFENL